MNYPESFGPSMTVQGWADVLVILAGLTMIFWPWLVAQASSLCRRKRAAPQKAAPIVVDSWDAKWPDGGALLLLAALALAAPAWAQEKPQPQVWNEEGPAFGGGRCYVMRPYPEAQGIGGDGAPYKKTRVPCRSDARHEIGGDTPGEELTLRKPGEDWTAQDSSSVVQWTIGPEFTHGVRYECWHEGKKLEWDFISSGCPGTLRLLLIKGAAELCDAQGQQCVRVAEIQTEKKP